MDSGLPERVVDAALDVDRELAVAGNLQPRGLLPLAADVRLPRQR